MDFSMVGIIGIIAIVVYLIITYGYELVVELKSYIDTTKLLTQLKDIAKMIADDKGDIVIEKIYEILLNSINYISTDSSEIDFEEMVVEIVENLEIAGIDVGEEEERFVKMALGLLITFFKR